MRRLIKMPLSSLRRSLASSFTGNLICDDGDDLLVQNYVLRVLSPLDPYKVRTGAALDLGVPDRSPQKLES
jgi:hypothetical protein